MGLLPRDRLLITIGCELDSMDLPVHCVGIFKYCHSRTFSTIQRHDFVTLMENLFFA